MDRSSNESSDARRVSGPPAIVHETDGGRRLELTDSIAIGREQGDVRLPDDPYLSHLHAVVERAGDQFRVRDCDSTNGTFIQVQGPLELRPGDEVLIGGQLFRLAT